MRPEEMPRALLIAGALIAFSSFWSVRDFLTGDWAMIRTVPLSLPFVMLVCTNLVLGVIALMLALRWADRGRLMRWGVERAQRTVPVYRGLAGVCVTLAVLHPWRAF